MKLFDCIRTCLGGFNCCCFYGLSGCASILRWKNPEVMFGFSLIAKSSNKPIVRIVYCCSISKQIKSKANQSTPFIVPTSIVHNTMCTLWLWINICSTKIDYICTIVRLLTFLVLRRWSTQTDRKTNKPTSRHSNRIIQFIHLHDRLWSVLGWASVQLFDPSWWYVCTTVHS